MFLHTPMHNPQYMKVPYKHFTPDMRRKYKLDKKEHKGYIYMRIKKGMYGLKQAAVLAYDTVTTLLKNAGYTSILGSAGLWKHQSRNISFCLCVDDFGVKYTKLEDLHHLKTTLEQIYTAKVNYKGDNFLGFKLDWQYSRGHVDISMDGYLDSVFEKLQHPRPSAPQYSPHHFIPVKWTSKGDRQYTQQDDTSPF